LPPEDKIEAVAAKMAVFHKQFMLNHKAVDEQAKAPKEELKLKLAFA